MTRFILFFLIGFLLAQEAFPAQPAGVPPMPGCSNGNFVFGSISNSEVEGYCAAGTRSNGALLYNPSTHFYVYLSRQSKTCIYRTCPLSLADTYADYCGQNPINCNMNGEPFPQNEPPPPVDCETGYVDGGGSLGCVFAGCPSGTKQVVHQCVPDTACVTTYCYSQPSEPAICKTVEVDCEETNTQNTTTNEQNGCSVFSPDYMGQDLQNRPRCRSDFPPDTEAPECANYKMGYVNNVQTFTCFDESTTDAPVNVVECGFGYISIDGNCEKTGVANREEKTHVVLNEDGSYSEVTESKDTFYNPDGTITTVEYTKTQKFNSDGTKDGSPEFSQEQKKEEADNRAVAGSACAKPPSCSGNAIGCAAIQQAWFTTCNVEQLKTLTDTKATSQLSAINSTNSKLDTLNNSTSQTNSKLDTANSSLDSIATNTNTTNSKLDSLLDVLNTANDYLNAIAGQDGNGSGGNGNGNGDGNSGCNPQTETCSVNLGSGGSFSDISDKVSTAQGEYDQVIADIKDAISSTFNFNLTNEEGGLFCNEQEIFGVLVDISICRLSEQLAWLRYVFLAMAYILAFRIIFS